jgi:hypothetical protein
MSEDELRREREHYASREDQWEEDKYRTEIAKDPGTGQVWPHDEAYDIGLELPRAEAENAVVDKQRTVNQAPATMRETSRESGTSTGGSVESNRGALRDYAQSISGAAPGEPWTEDVKQAVNRPTGMETATRDSSAAIGSTVQPLRRDPDNPSNYSDAIENNRRRPDPATVWAERGFERAKESAVRSAQRMRSRIYDTKR